MADKKIVLNFVRGSVDTKNFAKFTPTNIAELGAKAYMTLGIPLAEAGDIQAFDVAWAIKPVVVAVESDATAE